MTRSPGSLRTLNPALWVRKAAGIRRTFDAKLFGVEFAQYHRELRRLVLDDGCQSLLDVGCGERSPIHLFCRQIPSTTGVDAHLPSIERSRQEGIHDSYIVANLTNLSAQVPERSFDCVVALDVIEHFTREDGDALLVAMERIARRKVVVFTPNGMVYQPPEPGNPFQEHLSGWAAGDMRARGYEVIGIAGWKPLRAAYVLPRWRPRWFWRRIALLTESSFEADADHAFQILCVKHLQ